MIPDSVLFALATALILGYLLIQDLKDYLEDRAYYKALDRAEARVLENIESGKYDKSVMSLDEDIQFEYIRSFNE